MQGWDDLTAEIAAIIGDAEADRAFRQLVRVVGEEPARSIVEKCYVEAGGSIASAQDLLRFGSVLTEVGGFIGVVGRSFRVASICKGADLGGTSPAG